MDSRFALEGDTMAWKEEPRTVQLYIIFLTLAAVAALVHPILNYQQQPLTVALIIYAALACLTARVNVKIPYTDVHFSMDTAFVYSILMIYGPLPAMVADGLSKIINTLPHVTPRAWYKVPFNVASGLLSVFAAGLAYYTLLPPLPSYHHFILPLLAMVLAYFLVNSGTVAVAICLSTRGNLFKLWVDNFLWTGIGFLAALSISVLIYLLHYAVGSLGFLISIPIIGLVYFSQRVNLKREEEHKKYVGNLELTHMSTVETLSLAIDAKDQTTHGHVHRVTAYLTKLAELMGITDETTCKGLRFAALVHDIGKIAIPDLILSKPGRFSKEEMERMKIHPVVGAQILKAVSFDFPIADTVLSHHERWDGNGYPHGIAGEEISRYSRMLSVCDVYDALRSDRPYRSAMGKEKALSILRQERNGAFDPEIVDVFIDHVDEMEKVVEEENRRIEELTFSTPSSTDPFALTEESNAWQLYGHISYSQQEMFLLYEMAQMVSKTMSVDEICQGMVTGVGKLIPYNTALVFLVNQLERSLDLVYVESRTPESFIDLKVQFGSGISGWVAQNVHPMRNVKPELELGELEMHDQMYLASLAVPLVFNDKAVGVLTLFSDKENFYHENHQELLSKLVNMVTPSLVNALKFEDNFADAMIDSLTGLGNLRAMRHYFSNTLIKLEPDADYTLCLIDLRALRQINDEHGHEIGDRVLTEVARTVEATLRPEDRCFRYGGDEFVIIAHGAGRRAGQVLTDRIHTAVTRLGVKVSDGLVQPRVSIGYASSPDDGANPEELLRVADNMMYKNRINGRATEAKEVAEGLARKDRDRSVL